jgi:hypothetical protein
MVMIRNLDAFKFVKVDHCEPSPKSRNLILSGFVFDDVHFVELHNKPGLQKSPPCSTSRRTKQQQLSEPEERSQRKKNVRFAPEKRNQFHDPPPWSPAQQQCGHWTKAARQSLYNERRLEARTIVQQERSWGQLPSLLKQIHIDSYCSWNPPGPDPNLAHLYRHEPERLLGLERLHAPWRRSRDSWNAEAAANYALRLALSLEESLTNQWGDDSDDNEHQLQQEEDHSDNAAMILAEAWDASFCDGCDGCEGGDPLNNGQGI